MAAIAATYYTGKALSLKIDTVAYHVKSWDFDPKAESVDMTNGQTAGWAHPEAGVREGNGSCVLAWPTAAVPTIALTPGIIYAFELIVSGTVKYAFNALIISCPVSIDARGKLEIRMTFQSQGAVTIPS